MGKVVIFDWGGVILHNYLDNNNDNQAIIRTIKSFNPNLTDEEAWNSYRKTLADENGIYISEQDDPISKTKWVERLGQAANFNTTVEEFAKRFSEEYLKTSYYKELVDYIHSLKEICKIGLFSDLIYCCLPALDKQVDLKQFDYVWLSYIIHLKKSSEEAFKLAEKDMQVLPQDILFIDDTTTNIENAKKRGWNTCQAIGLEFDKIKDHIESFLGCQVKTNKVNKRIKRKESNERQNR